MRFNLLLSLFISFFAVSAQLTEELSAEVKAIQDRYIENKPVNPIIFAGSSSIRMWSTIHELNPDMEILNHGFGGSKMSDLILVTNELILDYNPSKVFIYEGDNDIAANRDVAAIMTDTRELIRQIRKQYPQVTIVLISAKPSISRWAFKFQYEQLNREFQAYAEKKSNIEFADVWTPMLNESGKVRDDIFIEDDLHLNPTGYAIWQDILRPFL